MKKLTSTPGHYFTYFFEFQVRMREISAFCGSPQRPKPMPWYRRDLDPSVLGPNCSIVGLPETGEKTSEKVRSFPTPTLHHNSRKPKLCRDYHNLKSKIIELGTKNVGKHDRSCIGELATVPFIRHLLNTRRTLHEWRGQNHYVLLIQVTSSHFRLDGSQWTPPEVPLDFFRFERVPVRYGVIATGANGNFFFHQDHIPSARIITTLNINEILFSLSRSTPRTCSRPHTISSPGDDLVALAHPIAPPGTPIILRLCKPPTLDLFINGAIESRFINLIR
jgi:hypothetical protein